MRIKLVGTALGVLAMGVLWAAGPAAAEDYSGALAKIAAAYSRYGQDFADMTIKQKMTIHTPQGEMNQASQLFRKGDKFRIDSQMEIPNAPAAMGKMETTVLYDGMNTWMSSPFTGKRQLPATEAAHYANQRNFSRFINQSSRITGEETVGGRACYVLETTDENKVPLKLWIDKDHFTLVQGEAKQSEGTIRWTGSDFRKVKGDWEMAYETKVYLNDELLSTVDIESVQTNTGLSDAIFNPDSLTAGNGMQDMIQAMMKRQAVGKSEE